MRVVTTCSKTGFEQYGRRALESWSRWPPDAELHFYTEGFEIPKSPRVTAIPLERVQFLFEFKRRFDGYRPPSYLWDVVKFSNKVFAATDALRDHDGIGVWLDADCVALSDIPPALFADLLGDAYLACFQRKGMYTETGLWIMDCAHPQHLAFLDEWESFYYDGKFAGIPHGWTDCHTLDATIRRFGDLITVRNLTEPDADPLYPMSKGPLSSYIRHDKGRLKYAAAQ